MKEVLQAFAFFVQDEVREAIRLTSGHIHATFHVATDAQHYILQGLNQDVFPDLQAVMHNAITLSDHLCSAPDYPLQVPTFYRGMNEEFLYQGQEATWRCLPFIGNPSLKGTTEELAPFAVAEAFGQFSRIASRLEVHHLRTTIPNFHDPERRWSGFLHAVDQALAERLESARPLLSQVEDRQFIVSWGRGKSNDEVAHNDPKPTNILASHSGIPLAIIDFDTVMPGSSFDDFGDLVRSVCCTHDENTDPRVFDVHFDSVKYEEVLRGFCAGRQLAPSSSDQRVFAKMASYIVFEQAIRFLGDYLLGDLYYHVSAEDQNLIRAHNQLTLLESMTAQLDLSS